MHRWSIQKRQIVFVESVQRISKCKTLSFVSFIILIRVSNWDQLLRQRHKAFGFGAKLYLIKMEMYLYYWTLKVLVTPKKKSITTLKYLYFRYFCLLPYCSTDWEILTKDLLRNSSKKLKFI